MHRYICIYIHIFDRQIYIYIYTYIYQQRIYTYISTRSAQQRDYYTSIYVYIYVCIYKCICWHTVPESQTVSERRLLKLLECQLWTMTSWRETSMRLLETHSILGWLGVWLCQLLLRLSCWFPKLRFLYIYIQWTHVYTYMCRCHV